MSNGTSGDINNVNFAKAGLGSQVSGEQARIVAESVSRAAFDEYKNIKHHDWVPLKMAQKEIELGVRLPSAAEVKQAQEIVAAAKGPVLKRPEGNLCSRNDHAEQVSRQGEGRLAGHAHRRARHRVRRRAKRLSRSAWRSNRRARLRPTFTIELANGYNGYLPTPEQHALGGYETWRARSSYVEVNASRAVTATLLDLLAEVAR